MGPIELVGEVQTVPRQKNTKNARRKTKSVAPVPRTPLKAFFKPCPDYLGPLAQAKWRELLPRLESRLAVLELDWDMLELYCHAYQSFRDADVVLRREGHTLPPTETGYQQPHPALKIKKEAFGELRRLGEGLGLFPNARKGLKVKTTDTDPLAAFLRKKPK